MAAIKIPEMAMTESEATAVAKAYADVAEFYPMLQQTAKAAAWTELFAALGMVYGLRLVAIRNRMMKTPAANPDNVVRGTFNREPQ